MKEILRSQWDYILSKKEEKYYLSVICGTVAIYEVSIMLNEKEEEDFLNYGEEYIKELSEKIRYSPGSYRERHIELDKSI